MHSSNVFRRTIEGDGVVIGARASTYSAPLIEVYGSLNLDYVRVDYERAGESPWNSSVFENLVRAAEGVGTELLVRLPSGDPTLVRRVLDTGVRNLLIPRVEGAGEVRAAIAASRFEYDDGPGDRGFAAWRSSDYGVVRDVAAEDDSVCLGVMIETAEAVDTIEDIVAVPELGFVFIGPNDLSVQYGCPGDREDPRVQDAIARVESAASSQGVPLGGAGHDPVRASELVDQGYQIVRLIDDFDAVREVYRTRRTKFDELRVE